MWPLLGSLVTLGTPTHGASLASFSITRSGSEATVTIVLATDAPRWIETDVPIAIAADTAVTALAVEDGWHTFVSRSELATDARAHFDAAHRIPLDELTGRPRDPALLEQTPAGLVLHVFPVAPGQPKTVRLYLRLPGESAERDAWMTTDTARRVPVDAQISLYAGPIVKPPPPELADAPPGRSSTAGSPHHAGLRPHIPLVPDVEHDDGFAARLDPGGPRFASHSRE